MEEMSLLEALQKADTNAAAAAGVPSVSRVLAAEVRALQGGNAKLQHQLSKLKLERDMWQSWEHDAQNKVDELTDHIRGLLEICRCWEPDYSTPEDRRAMVLAREAIEPKKRKTTATDAREAP